MKKIIAYLMLINLGIFCFPASEEEILQGIYQNQEYKEFTSLGECFNIEVKVLSDFGEVIRQLCSEYSRSASYVEVSCTTKNSLEPMSIYFSTPERPEDLKRCY